MINKENLAYLSALFPESELMREQLLSRRARPKQPLTPSVTTDTSYTNSTADSAPGVYNSLHNPGRMSHSFGNFLSTDVIVGQKDQVLFLLVLVSAGDSHNPAAAVLEHTTTIWLVNQSVSWFAVERLWKSQCTCHVMIM